MFLLIAFLDSRSLLLMVINISFIINQLQATTEFCVNSFLNRKLLQILKCAIFTVMEYPHQQSMWLYLYFRSTMHGLVYVLLRTPPFLVYV
jgi:hypothetical protein